MKTFSKRGSALLIVLGLLSFLLISAVAFSISMRTEHSAAAAYRRSLQARELLATAFANAQATLDSALQRQQTDNGFDRNNTDTYTIANLAPFKYTEADNLYGRLIASIPNSGNTPADHAYLLDEAVMSHVPPYVADAVYRALEENDFPNASAGETVSGEYDGYGIDTAAYWRAIKATVPKVENSSSDIDDVKTTTVGRMAWAIINLSDSIDINAIGSASTQRGLGLTGSELGFGTEDSNVTTFDLFDSASDVSDQSAVDLPTFVSNADLAQYAAMSTNSMLITDDGGVYPYSWVSAVEKDGPSDEYFFSPFSVYSFYPSTKRADENGAIDDSASSGSSTVTTDPVSCNDLTESNLTQGGTVANNLGYLYNIAFYGSKSGSDDDSDNFVRLLFDYLDKDSVPNAWGGTPEESAANSVPTVENVPMLSEVAYDTSTYWTDEKAGADFATAIKDGIDLENCSPEGKGSDGISAKDLGSLDLSSLKGNEGNITLTIPTDATITVDLRTYLPGYEELTSSSSSSSFGIEVEGFVGAQAAGSVAGDSTTTFSFTPGGAKELENLSPLSLSANALFENGSVTFTVPQDLSFTIDEDNAAKILTGIKNEASDSPATSSPKTITLNILVDFFFRVKVTSGSDVVDLCPVAVESSGLSREREYGAQDYPADITERFTSTEMAKLDASYFRVTCPVSATFKLQWVITQESSGETNQGNATYSVALEFETEPEGTSDAETSLTFLDQTMVGGSTGSIVTSYNAFSPAKGAWYTVDPRYNWLSPMMGVSGAAGDYGVSLDAFVAALSSPHWLFDTDGTVTSSQTSPSEVQETYAEARKNADIAPFNWGLKVEDIRYGHNDLGQMLLPGEIGFIPVPLATSDWSPARTTYNATSLSSYLSTVGLRSFFRTLPITDLGDEALSGESEKTYEKCADLMASIDSFSGDHFPEEHRGIANVFAAQDNYLLAQQLRQFAMLGIPRSIRAAAYNTYQRLNVASGISRVNSGILEDLSELKDLTAGSTETYNTFVCNYLFPIERNDDYSWSGHTRPQNRNFLVTTSDSSSSSSSSEESFAERFTTYNEENSGDLLGQNDLTTLLSVARESFGDRQQLFLFILRADALAATSVGADLSQATPISIARAVALVWRDAYGELPDRVIYYQVLP